MLKKINDILAGLPMTIIGGIFLVFSFVLPRVGIELPVDPAWATVVISGIPLLYLAIWRVIQQSRHQQNFLGVVNLHRHVCRYRHR